MEDENQSNRKAQLLRELLEAGFHGGCDIWSLLEKYGVDSETWESWLRDRDFSNRLVALARAMSGTYAPRVWGSLLSQVDNGSVPAMKLYFELWKTERNVTEETREDPVLETLRSEIFRKMPSSENTGEDETE